MAEQKTCSNCKESVDLKDQYCWNCGQKTKDLRLNFWHFITEFFTTVFNIDNKFFQTVIKLFIPAQLTIDFFEGIRKKYYHPARIYFVSILLLFFIISKVAPKSVAPENESEAEPQELAEITQTRENDSLDNTDSRFFKKTGEKKQGKRLTGFGGSETSILAKQKEYLAEQFESYKTDIDSDTTKALIDSLFSSLFFVHRGDTLILNDSSELVPLQMKLLYEDVELSLDDRFFTDIDSVVAEKNLSYWSDRMFLKRQLVMTRGDFNQALYANLTWLLLALVPIHALILGLVYYRRKKFFIEHYVFLLELFSAIMLITSFFLLFLPLFKSSNLPLTYSFIVSSIFTLLSFKRFYDQSWVVTIFKFFLVGLLFLISAILAVLSFALLVAIFF